MTNKYPAESPTPNWPKELKPEKFDRYCGPVLEAVREGIESVIRLNPDDPAKLLDDQALYELSEKWMHGHNELTPKEVAQLQEAYALRVDMIHMLSDF